MIVEILKDIFDSNPTHEKLDKLWHIIEGRHHLFMKDDEDIDALMTSSWYESLRETYKNVIRELIVWSLQNSSSLRAQITISYKNQNCFSIQEASRYLSQTFVILLENIKNDAYFFDALLTNFPKEGKPITEHKNEGWLEYGMGGGTTIPDVIESKKNSFKDECFTKNKCKYLRFFVLIDSDKEYPEMPLRQEKTQLIQFLQENEIEYHCLEKREIENYLPEEAFEEIEDNREYIGAYLRLTPIQKDFFDLEKGLPNKRFEQLTQEIQQLFGDVPDGDKAIFRKDNLKRINSSTRDNFKTDFPQLFQSEKVTKKNLLERCSHHSNDPKELPNLLLKISKLL